MPMRSRSSRPRNGPGAVERLDLIEHKPRILDPDWERDGIQEFHGLRGEGSQIVRVGRRPAERIGMEGGSSEKRTVWSIPG